MTRNRATAKKAGTSWESEIVRALVANGWPHAERRRLAGALDRGDIAGVAGIVIEAKNTAHPRPTPCPTCGLMADNAVIVRGALTASATYVCTEGHLYAVTWTEVA